MQVRARVERLLDLAHHLKAWRPNCRFTAIRRIGDVGSTALAGYLILFAAIHALRLR